MKLRLHILCFMALNLAVNASFAQCPTGYTTTSLNWDYLDYFSYTGNYTAANGYLSSNLLARTQNFSFGSQRLTIAHNYSDANSLGENTAHTGEAGSHGTGMDVQFIGNGTITLTFENEVQNLDISLYDVDRSQRIRFDARDVGNTAKNVSLSRLGTSVLTLSNNNTPTAQADASTTIVGATSVNATLNVSITGPLKSLIITITNTGTGTGEDGSFWLSDISACTTSSFPTNYYHVSRPFTGQPGYILHSFDRSVYAVNPANGVTKLLFTDPGGNINSMGYDPYNKILYYVFSLTATPGANRALKKYDFNTGTPSVVLADITSIGIPVVTATGGNAALGAGVESGAAAFYNGSLYLGIETGKKRINNGAVVTDATSLREAVIWRIDFNASNMPYRASQVFAMPVDDGSNLTHDWSDFAINNGILYDFDGAGAPATTETGIYHYNLFTGATTTYASPTGFIPGQPTVDWNNNLFQLYAIAGTSPVNPYIAPYNSNGTIGTRINLSSTPMFVPAQPSLGDAAEGFRPKADFGDAPASYDANLLAPALHEIEPNLRLGAAETDEWSKITSAAADADGGDDGLTFVRILNMYGGNYQTDVNVFNNTGADATLAAWVDFNNDNAFQSSEGIRRTVSTSALTQTIPLFWTGITQNLPNNSTTFLRIRITSAANGMTEAHPTGYFANGEVEDYQVPVNVTPLAATTTSFTAKKSSDDKVLLNCKATGGKANTLYELQRSGDNKAWSTIDQRKSGTDQVMTYSYTDAQPLQPASYYRLKYTEPGSPAQYSRTEKITFSNTHAVRLFPNPAADLVYIDLVVHEPGTAVISFIDLSGNVIYLERIQLEKGSNRIPLLLQQVPQGIYTVKVQTTNKTYTQKLFVNR